MTSLRFFWWISFDRFHAKQTSLERRLRERHTIDKPRSITINDGRKVGCYDEIGNYSEDTATSDRQNLSMRSHFFKTYLTFEHRIWFETWKVKLMTSKSKGLSKPFLQIDFKFNSFIHKAQEGSTASRQKKTDELEEAKMRRKKVFQRSEKSKCGRWVKSSLEKYFKQVQ